MVNSMLMKALQDITFTENGMPTYKTAGSANIDFHYKVGGMRGYPEEQIVNVFKDAWLEDPLLAMKNLFATRNIRGGKGERRTSRILLQVLARFQPDWVQANLHLIPHWGRWDDLFYVFDGALQGGNEDLYNNAVEFYAHALLHRDGLAAKYAPRHGKSKWRYGQMIIKALYPEYDPGVKANKDRFEATYRRLVSEGSHTVEQKMSAREWEGIDLKAVPSQAHMKYRKAFKKHIPDIYAAYLGAVKRGETKIHASTLQPHQIIEHMAAGDDSEVLDALWLALPNYLAEGSRPLAMADVSGSMTTHDNAHFKAIAISLYLAERMPGVFNNSLVTFSRTPGIFVFSAGAPVREKISEMLMHSHDWGFNTNFIMAMQVILSTAKANNVPVEEFPTHIIVLSDMQFDQSPEEAYSLSVDKAIKKMYDGSGYEPPVVVFWNLRTSVGVPAKKNDAGFVLVSGFGTAVIEHVLGEKALVLPKKPTTEETFALAMQDYSEVVVPQKYLDAQSAAS